VELLGSHIHKIAVKVLSYDSSQTLAYDKGFFQLGMDSLMAMDLRNQIQKSIGRPLRTTLAFDFPSINLLTQYLLTELFPQQKVGEESLSLDSQEDLDDLSHEELTTLLDIEMRSLEDDL
jgi:acyl carrier protein